MYRESPLVGAIVAMTQPGCIVQNRIIGINGQLPWHYSGDLKRFKKRTNKTVIVMGRRTWESIGCKKLPNRINVVVSRSPVHGVEHYNSVEKAIAAYPQRKIWFIGGGEIYRAAMPYLNLLDVTYVPDAINETDTDAVTFPEIEITKWKRGKKIKVPHEENLFYVIYRRIVTK